MLNARFKTSRPSNDLHVAGVVVRGMDASSDPVRPWLACHDRWCAKHGDHFSASLIYPGHTDTYGLLGFVIDPDSARLNCAYPMDGGTQGTPGGCKGECDLNPASPMHGGCMYWPGHLQLMIERLPPDRSCERGCRVGGMNELVFDSVTWEASMPRTIVAVFYKGDPQRSTSRSEAERDRQLFLSEYKLPSSAVPLLHYDPTNLVEPFADG